MRWISENIPVQYDSIYDVWRAYDALARASIFLTRAKLSSWDMLSYTFDLMGPGVAMAEIGKKSQTWKAKWKKYQFPTLVQQLYRSKKTREIRDEIIGKIGRKLHSSSSKVYNDVFPLFVVIASADKESIQKSLGLTQEEIDFMESIQALRYPKKPENEVLGPADQALQGHPLGRLELGNLDFLDYSNVGYFGLWILPFFILFVFFDHIPDSE